MRPPVVHHPAYVTPLPAQHRFPMPKFARLLACLRERDLLAVELDGWAAVGAVLAKALIGNDRLITVYVQASPAVCRERDPQGLYAAGGDNIPGESFPYDIPLDADLVIDTQTQSVEEGVKAVLDLLRSRGAI